jgi:hypothetical protein
MLKKSKISKIKIWSDEWYIARLAKFTSSEIYYLMSPSGFGYGSLNYIRRKVGEELTGESSKADVDTDITRWGIFHESTAVEKFAKQYNVELLIVQQLIAEPNGRFGSTPDGLIPIRISPDDTEYEVEPVEVKCPPTFDNYIRLFECETPQDLRQESKQYYWQVIDQLDNCGSLVGHFVAYHPTFKAGNMRVIRFDAMQSIETKNGKIFPIYNDLRFLRERKKMGEEKFNEIRDKLISCPCV